jgi:hypothetical protein
LFSEGATRTSTRTTAKATDLEMNLDPTPTKRLIGQTTRIAAVDAARASPASWAPGRGRAASRFDINDLRREQHALDVQADEMGEQLRPANQGDLLAQMRQRGLSAGQVYRIEPRPGRLSCTLCVPEPKCLQ